MFRHELIGACPTNWYDTIRTCSYMLVKYDEIRYVHSVGNEWHLGIASGVDYSKCHRGVLPGRLSPNSSWRACMHCIVGFNSRPIDTTSYQYFTCFDRTHHAMSKESSHKKKGKKEEKKRNKIGSQPSGPGPSLTDQKSGENGELRHASLCSDTFGRPNSGGYRGPLPTMSCHQGSIDADARCHALPGLARLPCSCPAAPYLAFAPI